MAMWLYAVGIDEVRDIFGADETLAVRLRALALKAFSAPTPPRTGLLNRVFRRKSTPPLARNASCPSQADFESLLCGRFIQPSRLPEAWQVMRIWLSELSWGEAEYDLAQPGFDALEFALARVGVPSPTSVGSLLANDAQLPLLPSAGTSVGYSKHHHVLAVRDELASRLDDLPQEFATKVTKLLELLDQFPHWAGEAGQVGRPAPDLLVIWDRGSPTG